MESGKRRQTPKQRKAYQAILAYLASEQLALNEQLPTFTELAERLDLTVRQLQTVLPWFAEEGVLEIVPHVGTFLRRYPTAPYSVPPTTPLPLEFAKSPSGKTRLRLFVQEYDEISGRCWSALMRAFEAQHPDCYCELTQLMFSDGIIDGADVLILSTGSALSFEQQDRLLPWVTDALVMEAQWLPSLATVQRAQRSEAWLPFGLGMQVLYVNAPALAAVDLPQPAQWTSLPQLLEWSATYLRHPACTGAVKYGCVLQDFHYPLTGMGYWSKNGLRIADVRTYLEALASYGPPYLVGPTEINRNPLDRNPFETDTWTLHFLRHGQSLFLYGQSWEFRQALAAGWDVCPAPLCEGDVQSIGAVNVAVRADSPVTELAAAFARFLISPEAQQILSELGTVLPVLDQAARQCPLFSTYQQYAEHGWAYSLGVETWEPLWHIRNVCWDLRTRRTTVSEAQTTILACDTRGTTLDRQSRGVSIPAVLVGPSGVR